MMRKGIKKGLSVVTSTVLVLGCMTAGSVFAAKATISMDGDITDWSGIESRAVNGGSEVSDWKVAKDDENLYFMFTGTATNANDYNWTRDKNVITIDGSAKTDSLQVAYNGSDISVLQDGWRSRPDIAHGFSMKATTDWNSPNGPSGPYVVEMSVPKAQYGASFSIVFAGTTVASSDMADLANVTPAESSAAQEASSSAVAETTPATQTAPTETYSGITIDGDMSDWNAVAKVVPADNRVKEVAAVWDGDYLYLYAKSGDWGSITWSGPNGNGKFAIESDLGYTELLQFKQGSDVVEGPAGTQYKANGYEWEIAIPKSALPNYTKSLNFRFYLGDVLIADIQNLDGSSNEGIERGEMKLDGSFEEWAQFPHSVIQYNTAGTNEMVVDAQGALYMEDGNIYGHVTTNMPSLVNRAGGEFSYAVMMFNSANPAGDNGNQQRYGWKLYTLDPSGKVINADLNHLSPGNHRFYVTNVNSGASSVDDPYNELYNFGEIIISVGQGGRDEMEFCLDTKEIARYFGVSAGDIRIASIYYSEIGGQWVTLAGTSTGPVLGIILCLAVVGTSLIIKKRRMDGRVKCVEA